MTAGLTNASISPRRYLRNGRAVRLERPGIEPGTAGLVRPAVDTIDTPQRAVNHTETRDGETEYSKEYDNGV